MLPNHISQFIWNTALVSLISEFDTIQDDTAEDKPQISFPYIQL